MSDSRIVLIEVKSKISHHAKNKLIFVHENSDMEMNNFLKMRFMKPIDFFIYLNVRNIKNEV